MKDLIVVYSSVGCAHCAKIVDIVKDMDAELIDVIKAPEERIQELSAKYGFLQTPTIIYRNKVIFSGNTPTKDELLAAMK